MEEDYIGKPKFLTSTFDEKIAESKKERLKERHALSIAEMRAASLRTMRKLTEKQQFAIKLMASFANPLTFTQIAKMLGVRRRVLFQWRSNQNFQRALDKEITKNKNVLRLEAYQQLFKKIRKGDGRALINYFKMTGDLSEKLDITMEDRIEGLDENMLDAEVGRLTDELGLSINDDGSRKERTTSRIIERKEKIKR